MRIWITTIVEGKIEGKVGRGTKISVYETSVTIDLIEPKIVLKILILNQFNLI